MLCVIRLEMRDKMKLPKGITTEFDRIEDGQIWFKVRCSKKYIFKTILKMARENRSFLMCLYAFYYLVKT